MSKAHIPPGGSQPSEVVTLSEKIDKIVKDFIILNEKTLMKNVHMCYIRVTKGKIENLKKEGKMRISILIFIYTIPESVHKIS